MKTPEELQRQEEKEKKKRDEFQRKRFISNLEAVVKEQIEKRYITSKGGTFTLSNFKEEYLQMVEEYLGNYGWKCTYIPVKDSWWSMTTKSESYYTVHKFYLKPLDESESSCEEKSKEPS